MGDTEIENQLKQMRAQLEALTQRVGQKEPSAAEPRGGLRDVEAQVKKIADSLDLPELSAHVGAILRTLGKEIQESKPGPLVAAFLAGVVVGRVTSR